MITVEVQYFHGCPNSDILINSVKEAIERSEVEILYREIIIDTPEKEENNKFRGSTTVLINGTEMEGLTEQE